MAILDDDFSYFDVPPPEDSILQTTSIFNGGDFKQAMEEVKKEEIDEEWWQDTEGATKMLIDGFAWGWGGEIQAHLGAGRLKAQGATMDYGEIYSLLKQEIDADEKEYMEKHLGASIGLQVLGSIPTGGLLRSAFLKAPMLTNMAAGAVYGLGASPGDKALGFTIDNMKDSATASVMALFGHGVLKSGGMAYNALTKRKIATPLGKGDDFIPITLATKKGEGALGDIYRSIVSHSFFGGSAIKSQENRVLDPIKRNLLDLEKRTVDKSKVLKDLSEQVKTTTAGTKSQISKQANEQKELLKAVNLDEVAQAKASRVTLNASNEAKVAQKLSKVTDELMDDFRVKTILRSIPSGTEQDVIKKIMGLKDMNQRITALDKLWVSSGFSMIKDRNFNIAPKKMVLAIKAILDKDLGTQVGIGSEKFVNTQLNNLFKYISSKTEKGVINGEALSTIRSQLGILLSNVVDGPDAALQKAVYGKSQDALDALIRNQLKGDALLNFNGQLSQWGTLKVLREAVTKASSTPGQRGDFTPEQWLKAGVKLNSTQARHGTTPLFESAQSLAAQVKNTNKSLEDVTRRLTRNSQAVEKKRLEVLKNDLAKEERKLELNAEQSQKFIKTENQQVVASEAKAFNKVREAKNDVKERLADIKATSASDDSVSIFSGLAATGILGATVSSVVGGLSILGLGGGGAAGIASGMLFGRFLAKQGPQRVMAGQTKTQEILQKVGVLTAPTINRTTAPLTAQTVDGVQQNTAAVLGMDRDALGGGRGPQEYNHESDARVY
jgi:hypothetical protein